MQLEVSLVNLPARIKVKIPPPEDPDVLMARLEAELELMFSHEYYKYLGISVYDEAYFGSKVSRYLNYWACP